MRHPVDKVGVSGLCDEYQNPTTEFHLRQKQLFEQGRAAFERKNGKRRVDRRDEKIARLAAKLTENNSVAELLHEHVRLKKVLWLERSQTL